ncbi:MAG: EF-Tu/IF-2/RF-3 family GTPase [Thermoplasmata archaeon]
MSGVTVAVVGSPGLAAQLGKRSTASDLTLFDAARDGHHTTFVEPTHFPEKFFPLAQALAMADRAILAVGALDRAVAETIATLEMHRELPVTVVRGPSVGPEELARALRGSRLASSPPVDWNPSSLREMAVAWRVPPADGGVRVPIDHAFPVKGVGAVALGVVRRGRLAVHETLRLWPTARTVEVRSIQVHDVDVREAPTGERVGVALRGVEADELERGQILAPASGDVGAVRELRGGPVERCRYYRGDWGEGTPLTVCVGLMTAPATVASLAADTIAVTADRPIPVAAGEAAYLVDLNAAAGPRLIGRFALMAPGP